MDFGEGSFSFSVVESKLVIGPKPLLHLHFQNFALVNHGKVIQTLTLKLTLTSLLAVSSTIFQ